MTTFIQGHFTQKNFDTEIAVELSVGAAILLVNIKSWQYIAVHQDYKNTWITIDESLIENYFPYWTFEELKRYTQQLVDAGYLLEEKEDEFVTDSYQVSVHNPQDLPPGTGNPC